MTTLDSATIQSALVAASASRIADEFLSQEPMLLSYDANKQRTKAMRNCMEMEQQCENQLGALQCEVEAIQQAKQMIDPVRLEKAKEVQRQIVELEQRARQMSSAMPKAAYEQRRIELEKKKARGQALKKIIDLSKENIPQ